MISMKEKQIVALLVLLIVFSNIASGQDRKQLLTELYLLFDVGVDTRETVSEKLKAEVTSDLFQIKRPEGVWFLEFSSHDCSTSKSTAAWALPVGRLEEAFLVLNEDRMPVSLESVILDPSLFQREQKGDVLTALTFSNEEIGVRVLFDTKEKTVESVKILTPFSLKKKYRCR